MANNTAANVAGASRSLSSSEPDEQAWQKFNQNVQGLLKRAQNNPNFGTAKFANAASDARIARATEGASGLRDNEVGMPFSPSQIQRLSASRESVHDPQARIAGEMGRTFGEQISTSFAGISDAIEQSGRTIENIKKEKNAERQRQLDFVWDSIDRFGSQAFADADPEDISSMEKAAGLPPGFIANTRNRRTLNERKFEASQAQDTSSLNEPLTVTEAEKLNVPFGTTMGQAIEQGITPRTELTGVQKFDSEQKLSNNFEKFAKESRASIRSLDIIKTGFQEAVQAGFDGNSLNAPSQAVLVTFQKMLDPTSVVRKSEYARSGEGLSLSERVKGTVEKLQFGGAGLTQKELKNFYDISLKLGEGYKRQQTNFAKRTQKQAENMGLNLENILTADVIDLLPPTEAEKKKEYEAYLQSQKQEQNFTSIPNFTPDPRFSSNN